jgi:hypothetical protein
MQSISGEPMVLSRRITVEVMKSVMKANEKIDPRSVVKTVCCLW